MTRSQTITLLAGPFCIVVLAGLAWRAYAPEGWAPKLPFAGEISPQESTQSAKEAERPEAAREAAISPPAPLQETTPAVSPPAQKPPAAPFVQPEFDVVRVEPSGASVIAGRGHPGDKIRLVTAGKVLAETLADASGQFVITPTLPPGDYELSLRDSDASVSSQQSVTVSVARTPDEKTIAALAEPGKPTVLLTPPSSAKSQGGVAFLTADIERHGLYATGNAPPNSHLRLYADDKAVADVTAGQDGRWSMRVANGLAAGGHKLRADSLDATGKVVARAEIPFEVPALLAAGKVEALPSKADWQATEIKMGNAIVQRGDTLWRISQKLLGSGPRYTQIYEVNSGQIRNPNLIYPGQVFAMPQGDK